MSEAAEAVDLVNKIVNLGFTGFLILEIIVFLYIMWKIVPKLLTRYENHVNSLVETFKDEAKSEREAHRANLVLLTSEWQTTRIQVHQDSKDFQNELRLLGNKIVSNS